MATNPANDPNASAEARLKALGSQQKASQKAHDAQTRAETATAEGARSDFLDGLKARGKKDKATDKSA